MIANSRRAYAASCMSLKPTRGSVKNTYVHLAYAIHSPEHPFDQVKILSFAEQLSQSSVSELCNELIRTHRSDWKSKQTIGFKMIVFVSPSERLNGH